MKHRVRIPLCVITLILTFQVMVDLSNAMTFNDHDYIVVRLAGVTYDSATADMKTRLGDNYHLATITSQEEHDFIVSLFNELEDQQWHGGFWLGGFQNPPNEPVSTANWEWVTGEPWNFTYWETWEPNDFYGTASEQHLAIRFNQGGWFWNDCRNNDPVYTWWGGYVAEADSLVVNFSDFGFKKIEMEFVGNPNSDRFQLHGEFSLSPNSDGINPINEIVTVMIGTSSVTIPSNSFEEINGNFLFDGIIDGVYVNVTLEPYDGTVFAFYAIVDNVDLTDTTNPVDIELAIGDDAGAANVRLEGKLKSK